MLTCFIFSPDSTKKYDNLRGVSLPALKGQMQVLSNHAESFILLKQGKIVLYKKNGNKKELQIDNEGGCYVTNNKVNIIL